MKRSKKFFGLALGGACLAAGFVFAGVSVKPSSLSELSAKAIPYCIPNLELTCKDPGTGRVYHLSELTGY